MQELTKLHGYHSKAGTNKLYGYQSKAGSNQLKLLSYHSKIRTNQAA